MKCNPERIITLYQIDLQTILHLNRTLKDNVGQIPDKTNSEDYSNTFYGAELGLFQNLLGGRKR